jgi:ABC-type sugar transport system ATPase subunit
MIPVNPSTPALRLTALDKVYPPSVHALRGVDFELAPGEIRALVGMNGAGKSTMIKLLGGNEQPTGGTIEVGASGPVVFSNPQAASERGIGVVHQELPLLPNLSAADNVALGVAEGRTFTAARRRRHEREYDAVAARIPGAPPASVRLEELEIDGWQLVAIVRALASGANILVLDEPTSSLNAAERDSLHSSLRTLASQGVAIIYVSHFLDDVLDIADAITVFRDGSLVCTRNADEFTAASLLAVMTGESAGLTEVDPAPRNALPDPVGLVATHLESGEVGPISLSVERGECVGLYGLRGSGATELIEAIFGLRPASGALSWRGVALTGPPRSRMDRGVSFVSGNRPRCIVGEWTVAMNHGLTRTTARPLFASLATAAERRDAQQTVDRFSLVGFIDSPMRNLSGGNQQKVSIGRSILESGPCLLADEPSRGVDAFARIAIHEALREVCLDGGALLVHSTEAEELVSLCHRVLVLSDGRVVRELTGDEITVSNLEAATARAEAPVIAASHPNEG